MARLALGGVLLTGQALAQAKPAKPAPPTLSELQEAGRQSEAGARAFTMGVYEAALPHFQKAYALGHKPADLQKVAESYRALGQNGAAYEAYTRLLATHGPALGFAGAIAVKKAIAELEATTGTMDVRSTPDGAVVRVGDLVLGVTPLSAPARLSAGATHVEVSKDGFEPFVTDVAIDPTHPATVDATLVARALTGHLAVTESHAAKADLLIDGQDVGPLPWEGDVPPGIHQLSIQATDLKAEPQTLKVVRGTRIDATFNADFITGALKVTAHPGSADIALDGKSIGTGTFEGRVAVGDHVLRVTAAGYKPVEKPVTIAGETPAASDVSLEREITPAEIAAAMAARDAEAIRGFYGQLTAFGTWPPVSTHIGCGDTSAPQGGNAESCSSGFAYGAGGTLRAGYSFGILGLEVVGGFMYGSWQDSVTYASSTGNQAPPSNPTIGSFAHNESYSLVYTGSMALVRRRRRRVVPEHPAHSVDVRRANRISFVLGERARRLPGRARRPGFHLGVDPRRQLRVRRHGVGRASLADPGEPADRAGDTQRRRAVQRDLRAVHGTVRSAAVRRAVYRHPAGTLTGTLVRSSRSRRREGAQTVSPRQVCPNPMVKRALISLRGCSSIASWSRQALTR
jgi:hypothetical protein